MKNDSTPVQEFALFDTGRLFLVPTSAHDVVVIEGSVLGGPNMLPLEQDVVPGLAAVLLDAGTAKKSKKIIREMLSGRGISLSFASVGDRTMFSGRCFPEDVSLLLSTIVECLTEAAFPPAEIKIVKALALGELAEQKSDTGAQAERALAAQLYDASHVNYVRSIKAEEESIRATRRVDLLHFRNRLGRGGLVLVVAGDISVPAVRTAVEKTFSKLGKGTTAVPAKRRNKKVPLASQKLIPIKDKANIDVLLGAVLPLTMKDDLYHPMKIATEMLGGGFTSHLMQTIRERDGLTYGVYARLAGFDVDTDGHVKITATFSPGRYAESVAKLRDEIEVFFSKGLTQGALTQVQERLVGTYLVSLSTTQNLATILHSIGIYGRDLSYLTEYPNIIRAVTLSQLHSAAQLIPLQKLALAASGTIPRS